VGKCRLFRYSQGFCLGKVLKDFMRFFSVGCGFDNQRSARDRTLIVEAWHRIRLARRLDSTTLSLIHAHLSLSRHAARHAKMHRWGEQNGCQVQDNISIIFSQSNIFSSLFDSRNILLIQTHPSFSQCSQSVVRDA